MSSFSKNRMQRTTNHSDALLVSDLDSMSSESSDTKGETETASSAHVGKVVVIEDVAFVTYVSVSHLSDVCAKTTCNRFQACFGTCTRTRLSSRHGAPRNDAGPVLLRRYQNRTGFPDLHPSLSTDSPTR
jgi:hypothetical protein